MPFLVYGVLSCPPLRPSGEAPVIGRGTGVGVTGTGVDVAGIGVGVAGMGVGVAAIGVGVTGTGVSVTETEAGGNAMDELG